MIHTDGQRIMDKILDKTHIVYKIRRKKTGNFLIGRPPHSERADGQGEMYETIESAKRSLNQVRIQNLRYSHADEITREEFFSEYEIVKCEVVNIEVIKL